VLASLRVNVGPLGFAGNGGTVPHTARPPRMLTVTAGFGRAQCWGVPIEEIRQGDVVWFPPGEKHWHGATASTAMTHIAIQEALMDKVVDWMEHVSDEQYGK
jgi:quercetin dioxygenase-like cupin family protein